MPRVIALDVETSGLPERKSFDEYFPPEEIVHYDRCRILSIAMVSDYYCKYSIIHPSGTFDIDPVAQKLHGISASKATSVGISLQDFFSHDLIQTLKKSDIILGHNVLFDKNILLSELVRNDMNEVHDLLIQKTWYCTMKNGKEILRLEKNPRLSQLYQILFQKDNPDAHHALGDARAALECHHRLHQSSS